MSGAPFPIHPVALLVENFRGLGGEHSLDLDRDLTVLVGKNGTGKSSLLVAVEWCLFGAEATTSSDSGIAERNDWALAHDGAAGDVRVTLELAVEGGRKRPWIPSTRASFYTTRYSVAAISGSARCVQYTSRKQRDISENQSKFGKILNAL